MEGIVKYKIWMKLLGVVLVGGLMLVVNVQDIKDSIVVGIVQYCEMLVDGNLVEFWEVVGEEFWKKFVGFKQVLFEVCDLGFGFGVVKGVYVKLLCFFKDIGCVMDVEQCFMYCCMMLQGLIKEEVLVCLFLLLGKVLDIEWLIVYVVLELCGVVIDILFVYFEEKCVYEFGCCMFFYCGGVYDFVCVMCYVQLGLCICLQELFDLLIVDGVCYVYFIWLGYCVLQGEVCIMQYCLYDCLCQQCFLELFYGSEVIIVLEMFFVCNVNGGKMDVLFIK